jgi:dTDP-4-dehydrorhamnose reductase
VRISPLLANDVANVLAALLARDVKGVFHAGAAHGLSKFEFGRLVAREFGFDEDLVTASVSAAAGLAAPRPRNLCLRSDRLARVLGVRPAAVEGGLTRLHELHRNGYRELLSGMLAPR